MARGQSSRSRTFSVPAGTALPDGTKITRDYRVTIEHAGSPGAAQKAARRQVAEQIRGDYPAAKFNLSQLQQSTARVNRTTGKARGGRKPKFETKERYQGKVLNHEVPKPKPGSASNWHARIIRVLRRLQRDPRSHYFGLAAFGPPPLRYGNTDEVKPNEWHQTPSFANLDAFLYMMPHGIEMLATLELTKIENATIVQVFPERADKDA